MTFIHAIILGIVEGFTEFLPISSTAHLMLAGSILKLEPTEFLKSFEIAIQLGAIAAVVAMYGRRMLFDMEVLKRVLAAFVPTAVIGFLLYKILKQFLLASNQVALGALLVGGILLILFEKFRASAPDNGTTGDIRGISYPSAFYIGLFQALAIVPGISRAAATIVGGMMLGVRRNTIVEFSFLLAVPTMLAATAYDLMKNPEVLTGGNAGILAVGFIVSFAVAMASIAFLLRFIKRHSFTAFGIYRIIIAVILWNIL